MTCYVYYLISTKLFCTVDFFFFFLLAFCLCVIYACFMEAGTMLIQSSVEVELELFYQNKMK